MKRGIMAMTVATLAMVALPAAAAASAGATQYFVTKFEGSPEAKMAFAVRSGKVENTLYQSPMNCGKGARHSLLSGEARDAAINDGRFASRTTYGPNAVALAVVRGRGIPASPNGFLRARFDESSKRTCRSGRLSWTARQVTVDAWRKYRAHQMGFGHARR